MKRIDGLGKHISSEPTELNSIRTGFELEIGTPRLQSWRCVGVEPGSFTLNKGPMLGEYDCTGMQAVDYPSNRVLCQLYRGTDGAGRMSADSGHRFFIPLESARGIAAIIVAAFHVSQTPVR